MKKIFERIKKLTKIANSPESVKVENLIGISKLWRQILFFDFNNRILTSKRVKILRPIFLALFLLNVAFYALVNSSYLVEVFFTHDFDLEKFTGALSYIGVYTITLTKHSCIYLNIKSIKDVQERLPKEYKMADLKLHKIDRLLINCQKFLNCFRYFNFSSIFFMALETIIGFIVAGQKTFPFDINFPFDASKNEVYLFLLIWIFLTQTMFAFTASITESTLNGLTAIISVEFKLFADKCRKLHKNPENIKSLIEQHKNFYEIVEKLQKIFSISFVVNFILSSFLICFNAFICSTASNLMTLVHRTLFCMAAMIQIFIQCFFGQMLSDANASVTDAIYDCEWESLNDLKVKKNLLIILMRSQKRVGFSLFGIYHIDLDQFKKVRKYF